MLGFIITQKCFKSDRDAAIIRYLSQTNTFSKFLKLTKKNHEKHLLIAILILCLSSFIAFFFFTKKSRYQDKI
jgi:hypothetical protein